MNFYDTVNIFIKEFDNKFKKNNKYIDFSKKYKLGLYPKEYVERVLAMIEDDDIKTILICGNITHDYEDFYETLNYDLANHIYDYYENNAEYNVDEFYKPDEFLDDLRYLIMIYYDEEIETKDRGKVFKNY